MIITIQLIFIHRFNILNISFVISYTLYCIMYIVHILQFVLCLENDISLLIGIYYFVSSVSFHKSIKWYFNLLNFNSHSNNKISIMINDSMFLFMILLTDSIKYFNNTYLLKFLIFWGDGYLLRGECRIVSKCTWINFDMSNKI